MFFFPKRRQRLILGEEDRTKASIERDKRKSNRKDFCISLFFVRIMIRSELRRIRRKKEEKTKRKKNEIETSTSLR